jgi:hypothetical protein
MCSAVIEADLEMPSNKGARRSDGGFSRERERRGALAKIRTPG